MFARGHGTVAQLIEQLTTGDARERARRLFTGDERFLLKKRGDSVQIDPELGVLLDDVSTLPLFAPERLYTVWGWISGPGAHTWLHYDNNGCHNLNAQITGHKRCTLYPPSALHSMRPFLLGGDNPAHNCCAVDIDADPEALAGVEAYEAELRAGDLLFIPCWWFHTFQHLGDFNTNVNFWYLPERPGHNPVAARQALLDAAGRAGLLGSKDPAVARLLGELDAALVGSD
jgi:lysine-specific demethylase 8